jgi:hypothetical protein
MINVACPCLQPAQYRLTTAYFIKLGKSGTRRSPEVSPAELGGIGYLPWQTTTFNGRGPGIARLVVQLAGRIRCGDTAGSRASSVTVTYELTDPGL